MQQRINVEWNCYTCFRHVTRVGRVDHGRSLRQLCKAVLFHWLCMGALHDLTLVAELESRQQVVPSVSHAEKLPTSPLSA
jgi:hypothetical protein